MGSSYAVGRGGGWVLACDICGSGDGVRRSPCPWNHCPSLNAHPKCLSAFKKDGRWAAMHGPEGHDCERSHAVWVAREAAMAAEPARYVRSAAGDRSPGVPKGMVGVVARDGSKWLVPAEVYAAKGAYWEPLFPHPDAAAWVA